MDREIVYPGQLLPDTTLMGGWKNAMMGLGYMAEATIGAATYASGLVCAPLSPASMFVTVGTGSIYAKTVADQNAYGSLGTDQTPVVKQGLLLAPQTLQITAPSAAGYSQYYLVEAIMNEADTGQTLLSYFNSSQPTQPYSGPNGGGSQNYTDRVCSCSISLKAGIAAPTGSETVPSADSGYIPLYLIVVTNGQTQITTANISIYPGAPFIRWNLEQLPAAIQEQPDNYAVDTGSANALAITLPPNTTLTPGMPVRIKKGATPNTGAITITINSGSPVPATWEDGTAFAAGDWPANCIGEGIYDGTGIRMSGPNGPSIWGNHNSTNVSSLVTTIINDYPSILPPRNVLLSQTSAGTGTATVPANVTWIWYEVMGSGGGGAGAAGTSSWSGGGGGSGGLSKGWLSVVGADTISWINGVGGVGCAQGNGVIATTGGTSSITHNTTTISATGGGGGSAGTSSSGGGLPGQGTGGQINYYGANGGDGNIFNNLVQGGEGAASAYGGGGRTATVGMPTRGDVVNGKAPGSGGGGVWGSDATSQTGGTGADGSILLMY